MGGEAIGAISLGGDLIIGRVHLVGVTPGPPSSSTTEQGRKGRPWAAAAGWASSGLAERKERGRRERAAYAVGPNQENERVLLFFF